MKEGKKCCLVVIDGWGENETKDKGIVDGIEMANPVFMNRLMKEHGSTLLYAHGKHVGLSCNSMMGNSEVGHLTIGAGRVIEQDSVRIRKALGNSPEDTVRNLFALKPVESIHILGILSDGGIHGNWEDIRDIANTAGAHINSVYIHTISDGRDTRPCAYLKYLSILEESTLSNVYIVSVSGRFYAMDRDGRKERTEKAYREITGENREKEKNKHRNRKEQIEEIREHINRSYEKEITDEFIEPFTTGRYIEKGETVLISNFRADRIKQIYHRIKESRDVFTMTRVCEEQKKESVLFERPEIRNTVGDIVEDSGCTQARIAETEKKAHVTFFFDGGRDKKREREVRIIHPSKKVETHDLAPEMRAQEITQSVCDQMKKGTDFILCNFANCDMVGHTGSIDSTVKAVKEVDRSIESIYCAAKEHKYALVITADHGNAEIMRDSKGIVKTHSINRVPVIVIREYTGEKEDISDKNKNMSLSTIGPTVLDIMGLNIPEEMTGVSLIKH